jgi:hypothetical protein
MRGPVIVVVWWLLIGAGAAPPAPPFDVLLAQVEARTVAASDVALARALRVFGFTPSTEPIDRSDVQRFVDALLIVEEAGRIGLSVNPADAERAWAAVAARVGSATLERWLKAHHIDQAWARRFVEAEVLRARFFEARFAGFVFVGDEQITGALGPGPHDEAVRERTREQIARATAEKAQTEWLVAARRLARTRILLPEGGTVEAPFPPPPAP